MSIKINTSSKTGFTIVELLIVVVVIAILATLSIVAYNGIQQRAASVALQSDLKGASSQLGAYNVENGTYPATLSLLNSGQGAKASEGTSYQYTYTALSNTYCISATSPRAGTTTYRFDSSVGSVEPGLCAGHVVSGVAAWSDVSTGGAPNCGISAGRAYCWGSANLGTGSAGGSLIPVPVSTAGVLAGRTVTSIAAGSNFACAVADAQAFCWGTGTLGTLGNGASSSSTSPVAVSTAGVLAGRTVTAISASTNHACAIADGRAFCWGFNSDGQLGNGTTTTSNVPVAVSTSGVLAGRTVTSISTGFSHTCAIADGLAFCWGDNVSGKLGNGLTTDSNVPVSVSTSGVLSGRTITRISAGSTHTCAVADALAFCWGSGNNGALGTGAGSSSLVPIAVLTSGVLSGRTVTDISSGANGSCVIADGLAFCWGDGAQGVLGNGAAINELAPVAVSASGVLSGRTLTKIARESDGQIACALSGSQLYCWGYGLAGRLGNNATANSNIPVTVINP